MNIQELCDRYGLKSRKAIYDRLNALGIQLAKDGNKSFATPDQVEVLDELNQHLINGGTLKNFTPLAIVETVTPSLNTVTPSLNNDTLTLAIIDYLANLNQRSPLDNYRDLEEAALKNWVLSSAHVEKLLGVKPKGESFTRGNWKVVKAGKLGNQTGWRVEKQ